MHLTSYRFALGAAVLLGVASGAALAAGDLSRQTPIELTVDLGSPGKHEFAPKQLRFETGKLYKLILRNSSSDPHYFTSHAFSQMVFTRKVQVTQIQRRQAGNAGRVQGRDPRSRGLSGTVRRMVAGADRGGARQRPALRHQDQRRQIARRTRHDRRDRHRVSKRRPKNHCAAASFRKSIPLLRSEL